MCYVYRFCYIYLDCSKVLGTCLVLNKFNCWDPFWTVLDPQRKTCYEFSSVPLLLRLWHKVRFWRFFSFMISKGKGSCEFTSFHLSTCTLICHRKLQNNLRIFLIFCKKGTKWKSSTLFEKKVFLFLTWGKNWNPKPQNHSGEFFGSLCNDGGQ